MPVAVEIDVFYSLICAGVSEEPGCVCQQADSDGDQDVFQKHGYMCTRLHRVTSQQTLNLMCKLIFQGD